MKIAYYNVSAINVVIFAIIVGVCSGFVSGIINVESQYFQLPIVQMTANKTCVKVENFANGDNYQCSDVGVILKKYKTETVKTPVAPTPSSSTN